MTTANLAIILIDARNGVLEQTLRHSYIASLLQIPHILVAINKMDLVEYSQEVFEKIRDDFDSFSHKLNLPDVHFVPISALNGDNVVNRSEKMDWYKGATLMYLLENIHIKNDVNLKDARFPVQYVVRPQNDKFHDFRGYAGRIAGGVFKPEDEVVVLPSGFSSKIKTIEFYDKKLEQAYAPQSVTITLKDDIDISRGDMIVKKENQPKTSQDISMMVSWFNHKPLQQGGKYILKHTTKEIKCMIKEINFKMNINTLEQDLDDKEIKMNDIAKITLRTAKPLFFDSYNVNRQTGSVIIVDEHTNETLAAGMII